MRGLGRRAVPDTEMFDELRSFVLLAMVAMVGLMLWSLQSCVGTHEAKRKAEYEIYAQNRIESVRERRQFVNQFVDEFADNLTYLTQIQIVSSRKWLKTRSTPEQNRDEQAYIEGQYELDMQWDQYSMQWANQTTNYASLIALARAYFASSESEEHKADVQFMNQLLDQIQDLVDRASGLSIYSIEESLISDSDQGSIAEYCSSIKECIAKINIPEEPSCKSGSDAAARQAHGALNSMHCGIIGKYQEMRSLWASRSDGKEAIYAEMVNKYADMLWILDKGVTELLNIAVLEMIRDIPPADRPHGNWLVGLWEAVRVAITVGVVFALALMYRGISAMRAEHLEDRRRIRRRSQMVWGKRRIRY